MMQLKDNMSNIEKIRQEVERLMKETEDSQFDKGERYGLKIVLEFIDSLPEEKLSEDMKDAAYTYSFESRPSVYGQVDVIDAFIAGAEWQKKQVR